MRTQVTEKMSNVDIVINVDIEKLRYSLVGDGYLREEVEALSTADLIEIFKQRITDHINREFNNGM